MSAEENSVAENKTIVQAWLAARNIHDLEAAVALWAEEKQAGIVLLSITLPMPFPM